jgi:hypothetical protein
MKTIRLTAFVDVALSDVAGAQAAGIEEALHRILGEWSDGRAPLSVELAQRALGEIAEAAVRKAVYAECLATIPEGRCPRRLRPGKSWTHPAVRAAERRCRDLHVLHVGEISVLQTEIDP